MKSVYKITLLFGITILVSSCHNNAAPNYQYFPNMYESVGYETYSESNAFKNGKEGQLPAEGTVNRGFEPFEYENSTAGYELAKANLKSPLDSLSRNPEKGKELFEIYCATCHGNSGNGKGKLVEREKFLGVPSYKDRVITEGSIFHVITYGLNSMGSHANQLSAQERWLVTDYVLKLKSEL
ncbi:cytochrome c [Flavobacterium sinopsychrotolerans]|jgi:mono/diheme cytochrome c family protein|uniref:Quinol:cytochrome c oxidoreductase monoheme cytochrome subunit n=1 Tax=Flavobacterium sinopsychrotolerans TaxID=604089 RepID=A0A1H8ITI6_9FLAO|nr:cytochrome c [Flavobacterium sinopsychrotolerans]SEN71326.1 quinol:cytochrome c oxidoreductase monoheme cytochrome subunit [Flavobacterium sinopsychrotolerans]